MTTEVLEVIQGELIDYQTPSYGDISPYSGSTIDGGFARQAPTQSATSIGSPTARIDAAWDLSTRIGPTGNREWLPTASEQAWNNKHGLPNPTPWPEYNPPIQPPRTGGTVGDTAVTVGGRTAARGSKVLHAAPYVGDVIGGAIEGTAVYGQTGSIAHGIGAGIGASVGGIAGSAIGGAVGSIGGPAGIVAGSIAGGIAGGALGSEIGQGIANFIDPLDPVNVNGVTANDYADLTQDSSALYGKDLSALGGVQISFYANNDSEPWVKNVSEYNYWTRETKWGIYYNITWWPCGYSPYPYGINNTQTYVSPPWVTDVGVCSQPEDDIDITRYPVEVPYNPSKNPTGRPPSPVEPIRLPKPVPTPKPVPLPEPDPTIDPTEEPIGGQPRPTDDTDLPGYEHPDPYPDDDPPNPNPTEEPQPEEDCDPCAKLDEIKQKLEDIFSEEFSQLIALPPCGEGEVLELNSANYGLLGLSQQIEILGQAVTKIWDRVKCDPETSAVALVPEWWAMRAGSKRPQLMVQYRGKNSDGTWNNTRRTFSIPHFDVKQRKALKSILPKSIKKGAIRGAYTLKDNSRMVQFCRNATEAERVLVQLERLIISSQRTGDIKIGEMRGKLARDFDKFTLYPFDARFFATGQGQGTPNWIEKLE